MNNSLIRRSLALHAAGTRGAVLAGDEATMAQAATWRRRLGGAIKDAWPLALGAPAGWTGLRRAWPSSATTPLRSPLRSHRWDRARVPGPTANSAVHVHVPASEAAVERAAHRMIAEHGTQLFLRVRTSPDASGCAFEITVGQKSRQRGCGSDQPASCDRELLARATCSRPQAWFRPGHRHVHGRRTGAGQLRGARSPLRRGGVACRS